MKALNVHGYRDPRDADGPYTVNRYHTVHLGNGRTLMFTSSRLAKACSAEVDRWLSAQLVAVNFLLSDAFAAYRAAWLLLDVCQVPHAEKKASQMVLDAWRGLDMAVIKSTGPNGWHFSWGFLRSALASIAELAKVLQDLHASRSNPVERQRMALLADRCAELLAGMASYGHQWPEAVQVVTR